MAARVPIIVEITVLVTATIKVFFKASSKVVLVNNILYHLNVKPSKIIFNLESLKEKAIKAIIGKYKNINTNTIKRFLSVLFFSKSLPNHLIYHPVFYKDELIGM